VNDTEDETLPDPRLTPSPSGRSPTVDLGERYDLGTVIGRGGMGEVRIARDTRIHRDVAVKLLRSTQRDDETVGRFFREARVQGVLEHPAVVPVHDLGIDPAGNPYFVMKRLTGTTLADVLASPNTEVGARWPRRTLLARIVDICLAVEFAHTRGVIHRDLKPANLMFGDFGEAYVLDWGLARLADDREVAPDVAPLSGDDVGYTNAGDLLGTPGYMSPEQARGDRVDARTDVFALGCILYEVLARAPALPRGLPGISATLTTRGHRPSTRVADVPPELDDLCARATAATPAERPTARQFADSIQAYLDGDRDIARRRELAEQHARAARDAMQGEGDNARATAMREAGRALAVDPANALAQEILGRLMLAAPTTISAEAIVSREQEMARTRQKIVQGAQSGYLSAFVLSLALYFLPLRTYWPVVTASIVGLASWLLVREIGKTEVGSRSRGLVLLLILTSAMFVAAGLMFGPLIVMPLIMVGAIAGFLSQPSQFHWGWPVAGYVVPFLAVIGLELAGVLPQTMQFGGGALILTAPALDLTPLSTALIVGFTLTAQVVNVIVLSVSRNTAQLAASTLVHAQRWHLKQLLPNATDVETGQVPKLD